MPGRRSGGDRNRLAATDQLHQIGDDAAEKVGHDGPVAIMERGLGLVDQARDTTLVHVLRAFAAGSRDVRMEDPGDHGDEFVHAEALAAAEGLGLLAPDLMVAVDRQVAVHGRRIDG